MPLRYRVVINLEEGFLYRGVIYNIPGHTVAYNEGLLQGCREQENEMAIVVVLLLILFNSDGACGVRWRSNGRKRAFWQSRGTVNSQRRSDPSAVPITTPYAPAATDRRIHANLSPDFSRKAWFSLVLRGGSMRRGDDADIGQETSPAGEDINEEAGEGEGLDENLYSRQLYVMGKSAMAKMRKADVLISGMR